MGRFDLSACFLAPLFSPVIWFCIAATVGIAKGGGTLGLMWLSVLFFGVVIGAYFTSMPIFWVLSKFTGPKRLNSRRHYLIFSSIISISGVVLTASLFLSKSVLILTPSIIVIGLVLNATVLVYFGHSPNSPVNTDASRPLP